MADLPNTQRSPDAVAARVGSCLIDGEILDFVAGRLDAAHIEVIHAHLDSCAKCQDLVAVAARKSSDPAALDVTSFNTTFRRGDVVGRRYRVQRFIARGGMGEVYEAQDLELKERVALKTVLATASDGARAVRRLKAEVLLARRVSHPNVCRIYDLGAHLLENGATLSFLTMEFVDGERLSERCARGRLSTDVVQRVVRQLLRGLEAAHGAGILHRDLKCDNVMLRSTPGDAVVPVIMDFGLARLIEEDATRVTSGVNGFMGTPCYMAPEQLEGRDLTPTSDLYSFGVMWFEMLTGRLPFSSRAPYERLGKRPARPSTICKDIPAGIEKIVLRCLERAPDQRYASAREVLVALDAFEAIDGGAGVPIASRRRLRVVWPLVFAGLLGGGAGAWKLVAPQQSSGIATAAARPADAPEGAVTSPASAVASLASGAEPVAPSGSAVGPVEPPDAVRSGATEEIRAESRSHVAPGKRRVVERAPSSSAPAPAATLGDGAEASQAPRAADTNEKPQAPALQDVHLDRDETPRARVSPEALGFANPFKHPLR